MPIRKSFKVTPSIRRKIQKLANKVGVKLDWNRSPRVSFQWDGKSIACKNQDSSNIIHDIAHFQVASKSERKVADFGIGIGPDSNPDFEFQLLEVLPMIKWGEVEVNASALGIYWEKQLGINWKSTVKYHSWQQKELEEEWKSQPVKGHIKKIGI